MNIPDNVKNLISALIENETLEKLVLYKSNDKQINKAVGKLVRINSQICLQLEVFYADNKAKHVNVEKAQAVEFVIDAMQSNYQKCDIFANGSQCQIVMQKNGELKLIGKTSKLLASTQKSVTEHNRQKQYILQDGVKIPFLIALGVMDQNGKVLKSKMDKFKQINRYLEFIQDIKDHFTASDTIKIADFACGKSYLTFAVHYYITEVLKRNCEILGVDLKPDVIEFCQKLVDDLNLKGIKFIQGDINTCDVPSDLTMSISLHACNIATDFAINRALESNAKVIICVPCCHHELADKISCSPLEAITSHGILRHNLAETLTDALRAKFIEAHGYKVQVLEFIDAGHTPKNVMIRAVRSNLSDKQKQKLKEQYHSLAEFMGCAPENLKF